MRREGGVNGSPLLFLEDCLPVKAGERNFSHLARAKRRLAGRCKNSKRKKEKILDKPEKSVYNNNVRRPLQAAVCESVRRSTQEAEEAPLLRV